ncbi:imp4 family u3 small nucleolar ribonucleoprotein [Cystoisospora suis]|uniref:Imp4 family u3 small nucleolar ribonucleoprotein n=1 Tax=Cystoisospora suis TaxID=483139 RepID=A0A2C6L5Z3_9APIC|nr:imp4 family u3 small nucleolar ribonucleoprotein [Cystoisospora suis]
MRSCQSSACSSRPSSSSLPSSAGSDGKRTQQRKKPRTKNVLDEKKTRTRCSGAAEPTAPSKEKRRENASHASGAVAKKEKKLRTTSTSNILNKQRRQMMAFKLLQEKKKERSKKKKERRAKERRGEPVEKKTPKTIESMRRFDPTVVEEDDDEVEGEEEVDEFASFFSNEKTPKLMVTTNRRVTKDMYAFLKEVLFIFPNAFFYKRWSYQIKNICKFAIKHDFTDLLIFKEKNHRPHGLYIVHLPEGPTSYFRISGVRLAQEMHGAATMTTHLPELLLNNFTTRLGRRVARQLAALFPLTPEFVGRRVVTFHNQRDFIFFRHHRYIFEDGKKTRLQEIGPRLTLKLLWMHAGLFNTKEGLYEFVWRPDLKVDRKNMLI